MSQFGVPTSEFARSVTVMTIDDAPLAAGLARSENAVTVAATKMQSKVDVATTQMASGFGKAGSAVSAFAALTGNSLAAVGAQIVALGGSLLTFVAGPVGIALAVATATLALLFNTDKISDWISGVEQAKRELSEFNAEVEKFAKLQDELRSDVSKQLVAVDVASRTLALSEARGEPGVAGRRQLLTLRRELDANRAAQEQLVGRAQPLSESERRSRSLLFQSLLAEERLIAQTITAVEIGLRRATRESQRRTDAERATRLEMERQQRVADEQRRAARVFGGAVRSLAEAQEFVAERLGARREQLAQSRLISRALDALGFGQLRRPLGVGTTELLAATQFTDIAAARGQLARGPTEDRNVRANERTAKSVEEIARVNARLQEGIENLLTAD